ncbi:oxidoreductase, partial [Spirochaetota bacterium]
MAKPKVALYWCASCGGCEETVVDLNEFILDVVAAVDIVLWPVALDFKYDDVRKIKDGDIAVSFINGAIRTSEQEEISKLLRQKSKVVIAFGSCSSLGGIPGLANFYHKKDIMSRAYLESESTVNPNNIMPKEKSTYEGKEMEIPEFYKRVYALDQIIDVDYYLPGCPPTPDVVKNALLAILEGKLPEKGAVLTENKALCNDCPRNDTKPETIAIKEFKRPH